jgi:hypothetical protein
MTEQNAANEGQPSGEGDAGPDDRTTDNGENELEAEQESAAAMDADVPQPPDADQTTEGQPS